MKDKDKVENKEEKEEKREELTAQGAEQPASDAVEGNEPQGPSLSEIIREQATEEDMPLQKSNLSLRKILGGDILSAEIVRKQIWLVLLITAFLIVYIAEGYSYKKYVLEIDKLTVQLKDAKYKALSSKSELTEKTRESKILEMLKINHDTLLHISGRPPYIVEVPE